MPRSRGSPASRGHRSGVRDALLHTLPGRAIVVGLVVRVAIYLAGVLSGTTPGVLGVVDTLAGVALALGAAYFVFRLIVVAKRRLLWRVRRKLILSYIFIGFIPVLLIVSFFLLGGLLLFFNVSSYLVQSRLRALEDRARFLAATTALEIQRAGRQDVAGILAGRQRAAAQDNPEASFAIARAERACGASGQNGSGSTPGATLSAGPWPHVEPPPEVPSWIGCGGFSGVFAYRHVVDSPAARRSEAALAGGGPGTGGDEVHTHPFVRAIAYPDGPIAGSAVIVDLPLGERGKQQFRVDTGVEMKGTTALDVGEARPLPGRAGAGGSTEGAEAGGPLNWITFVEYRDWQSGAPGTLLVSTQPSISVMYERISGTQSFISNRNSGQFLLFFLVIVGGLFLVIEAIALIAGLALARSITGSVHELFAGTERVRQGDFTHKIAVHTDDQLGELAGSFNSMTASIEDLLRESAEKKRLEEELRIAREIQMSLLPQGAIALPGVSITALCLPAREVGGDYYDFFQLTDRRLGVLIADVSGKGTSAALYMAELKGLLLSLSRIYSSPRDLMLAADRIMAANLDARSFITMAYAVIDLDARTMTYARAGHTPLIYVPGPHSTLPRGVQVLAPDGLVLGLNLDNGETFERLLEEETIPLDNGDLAVFFTDGISEAMNEVDDCFGEARLSRLVEEHASLSPNELRERVLREIEAFVGAAPQHDDMTIILLKFDGLPEPAIETAGTAVLAGRRE